MQFAWPTPEQTIYRIQRLRRLIVLCVAIPVVGLMLASFIDPASLPAERATVAALAVAMLIVGHVVLFPNVTLETLAFSLAVTGLVIAVPWIKAVAHWAPDAHVNAALVILIAFAVAATGVLMALIQIVLAVVAYAGPALKTPLVHKAVLPCSPAVARRQCALQPAMRRGRVLTGEADEHGFFDVAVAALQHPDPADPTRPLIVRADAKVLGSDDNRHDLMLHLPNGSVTVTSHQFATHADGCEVTVRDLPGDFTAGMHAIFWLTDQQADNLTEMTDVIIGQEPRANGLAHGVSLLAVAGALLSPRATVAEQAD